MSILIKGMEMPKSCYYCQFLWFKNSDEEGGEGMCDLIEKWVAEVCDRPDWCPLVEVPKHGRLIDADELLKRKGDAYDSRGHLLYAVGTGSIVTAPTIIEAEE